MKYIFSFLFSFLYTCPAFAQGASGPKTISDFLSSAWRIVTAFIPVAFGVAVFVFFFGIAKFMLRAGDDRGRSEGKQIMLWGIIALFVISTIWGIIILFANFFGVGNIATIQPPQLPALCPNGSLPPCT